MIGAVVACRAAARHTAHLSWCWIGAFTVPWIAWASKAASFASTSANTSMWCINGTWQTVVRCVSTSFSLNLLVESTEAEFYLGIFMNRKIPIRFWLWISSHSRSPNRFGFCRPLKRTNYATGRTADTRQALTKLNATIAPGSDCWTPGVISLWWWLLIDTLIQLQWTACRNWWTCQHMQQTELCQRMQQTELDLQDIQNVLWAHSAAAHAACRDTQWTRFDT